LSINSLHFVETIYSSPCSPQRATAPYAEPYEVANPRPILTLFL
jgi:hypothetical protein